MSATLPAMHGRAVYWAEHSAAQLHDCSDLAAQGPEQQLTPAPHGWHMAHKTPPAVWVFLRGIWENDT